MTTTLATLTQAKIDGTGVFDQLMIAAKAHLDAEFKKGTIKGPEYSQVYLGQLQAAMSAALQFLAFQAKADLEAQLMQKQIDLTQAQITQAAAQTDLVRAQIDNAVLSDGLTNAQIDHTKAQVDLVKQQTANALAESQNLPKQGEQIDAQTCLLKAQYDNTVQTTLRVSKETDLMAQKIVTEKAQTMSVGVEDNSVVGRQKLLYQAQTAGFQRDAEQKAASLLVQAWNTNRMTDDGISRNTSNRLDDATIGSAVQQLLTGINVTPT